jgi:hypothetical protein
LDEGGFSSAFWTVAIVKMHANHTLVAREGEREGGREGGGREEQTGMGWDDRHQRALP